MSANYVIRECTFSYYFIEKISKTLTVASELECYYVLSLLWDLGVNDTGSNFKLFQFLILFSIREILGCDSKFTIAR